MKLEDKKMWGETYMVQLKERERVKIKISAIELKEIEQLFQMV